MAQRRHRRFDRRATSRRSRRNNPDLSWPLLIVTVLGGAIVGAVGMHYRMKRRALPY